MPGSARSSAVTFTPHHPTQQHCALTADVAVSRRWRLRFARDVISSSADITIERSSQPCCVILKGGSRQKRCQGACSAQQDKNSGLAVHFADKGGIECRNKLTDSGNPCTSCTYTADVATAPEVSWERAFGGGGIATNKIQGAAVSRPAKTRAQR